MKNIIAQGAEAELILLNGYLIKKRIRKNYRLPEIDLKIRYFRTSREFKIMNKLNGLIKLPKTYGVKDFSIMMEFIDGTPLVKLLDVLKHNDREKVCEEIGKSIAIMHNNNIIHGDLTTSNMLLRNSDVYFIDFGLSLVSLKPEDKAVDLHLAWQSLNSRHYNHSEKSFESVLKGYKNRCNDYETILNRLNKVKNRGRYKMRSK